MKKLWVNIAIFFGCFLLLVTTLGAVLIIAPGMELLGIMYIRSTSGSVHATQSVSDAVEFQTIEIQSDNIPVVVEFVQSYSLTVEFVENYDGYCKAAPTPYFEMAAGSSKLKIKSYEYQPIFGFARDKESGLFVKIPMYYENDIVINSKKSKIQIAGQKALVHDITINSAGEIYLSNDMEINSLNLNFVNKSAIVADSVRMSGKVVATSKRGDLTLPVGFTGMVDFNSSTGDLACAGCGQMMFKSTMGRVKGVGDKLPIIAGDAEVHTGGSVTIESIGGAGTISSKHGKITLGKDGGVYSNRLSLASESGDIILKGKYVHPENIITTKQGDVTAEHLAIANISTKRGSVSAKKIDSGKIITNSGDVEVENIEGLLEIQTKNGDVELGAENAIAGNALITTRNGDVSITNAGNGKFEITTKKGDVEFVQKESCAAELVVKSEKGDIELNNVSGKTTVETAGEIDASILNISDTICLKGKNKKVDVKVQGKVYLDLTSKKKIVEAPGMEEPVKAFKNVPEGENKYLKIETKRGKISVRI